MNKALFLSFLCLAVFLCNLHQATGKADARLSLITSSELQKNITQTPLASPLQQQLLSRARQSHLIDIAYYQYTTLWKQHPNDPELNVLRGISAEYLQSDSMKPELRQIYRLSEGQNLFSVASECLAKGVALRPASALACSEYGFFLWQFGNRLPQGLALLSKATKIDANNPHIHAIWGLVYANPDGGAYNLRKAVYELKVSSNLDPSYAFPHELLANIYTRLNQTVMAMYEQNKFQQLLP